MKVVAVMNALDFNFLDYFFHGVHEPERHLVWFGLVWFGMAFWGQGSFQCLAPVHYFRVHSRSNKVFYFNSRDWIRMKKLI